MNKNNFEECVKQVLGVTDETKHFGFVDVQNNLINNVMVTTSINFEIIKECEKNKIDTIVTFADPKCFGGDEKRIEMLQKQIEELKTKNKKSKDASKDASKDNKGKKKSKDDSSESSSSESSSDSSSSSSESSSDSSSSSSSDSKSKNKDTKKTKNKDNKKSKGKEDKNSKESKGSSKESSKGSHKNTDSYALNIGNNLVAERLQDSQFSIFVINTYANKIIYTNLAKKLNLTNITNLFACCENNQYTIKEIINVLCKMLGTIKYMLGNERKLSDKHKKVIVCLEPAKKYHKEEVLVGDCLLITLDMDYELMRRYEERGCSVIFIDYLLFERSYKKDFANELEKKLKEKAKALKIKKVGVCLSKKDVATVLYYNK